MKVLSLIEPYATLIKLGKKKIEKDKFEFICGDYRLGRYAFILEDIEVLDNPMFAKGKLGI